MLVFKHAVSVSCLLATLSIMGLTLHTMVRQPSRQSTVPTMSAQVATVGAATVDAPVGQSAAINSTDVSPPVNNAALVIPDAVLTGAADTPTSSLVETHEYSVSTLEKQIHSRTNITRSQNHLPALHYDAGLAAIALAHSEDMVADEYFSHTDRSGCDLACRTKTLPYQTVHLGENLAQYTQYQTLSESELAATLIEMWLKSGEHRDHIYSGAFAREGIGVATKGDRIVVTVLYAQ